MVTVLDRIGYHKILVAITNKHARIIWALLVRTAKAMTGQTDVCRPRLTLRQHQADERMWSKRAVFQHGPRQQ